MNRRMRMTMPLIVGLGAMLVGCGSTVSLPPGAAGTGGQGLGVPGAGASAGPGGAGGLTAGEAVGAGGGSGEATGPASTSGGSASSSGRSVGGGGGSSGGAGKAPGVTPTTITVGVPYTVNGKAANESVGARGITTGDVKGETQVVINDINKHGGILGRKIVPVWHEYDATSNQTEDSVYQSMCANFTQDHHVFVIFAGESPIIQRCAQQHGAVAVTADLSVSSARTFQQFPSYFEVSTLDLNRIALNEVRALAAQDYFTPWNASTGQPATSPSAQTRVGVITYDHSSFRYAVQRALLPELARVGHSPSSADIVYVDRPQRTSDVGQMSAQVSNAVLRFRQHGVEHVLILDERALITLEFLNAAQSQQYFPRYGWGSQNGPQALAGPGNVPKEQMAGSMGIGWLPILDLRPSDNDNGKYSNQARRDCIALMKDHGYSFSDANAKGVALTICDEFNFFKAALKSGGPTINQAAVIAGVNKLGWSFRPSLTFNAFFSPEQHNGAGGYRHYAWNAGCGCMHYTSGVHRAVGEGIR